MGISIFHKRYDIIELCGFKYFTILCI